MTYAVMPSVGRPAGQEADVERCLRALIEPSRREPGNLAYQPHRDPEDPRVFHIYEHYVDEASSARAPRDAACPRPWIR